MKKCVNGEYVEMTAEEMAALSSEEMSAPSVEERLSAVETSFRKLQDLFSKFGG